MEAETIEARKPSLNGLLLLAMLSAVVGSLPGRAAAAALPRYVFLNKAAGIDWDQNRPASFTAASCREIIGSIDPPESATLKVGVAFMFSLLQGDPAKMCASVRAMLQACEDSGMPLMITLDGQQWWESRADLWNWWDPTAAGYDPRNRANVEWTNWDPASAIQISWRNWGRQVRVAPAPNIASPQFLQANLEGLRRVLPIIVQWYWRLPPQRRWLLGAVKLGDEAGTGYNAFYYPDGNQYRQRWPNDATHDPQYGMQSAKGLSGGVAQIGYAAVKAAEIRCSGQITRDDLAQVTAQYLAALAKEAHRWQLPPELVYVHQGGTYPPWGTHIPFCAAFNEWSTPGWSFYGLDPHLCGGLADEMDKAHRTRWAAVEWWWAAATAAGWREHFERTLHFKDCRFIGVYNWDGKCFSFRNAPAGQAALHAVIRDWQ